MHHVFEISTVVQRNGLLDEPHWTRPWSEKHRAFLQLQWHRKAHGNEEFPKKKRQGELKRTARMVLAICCSAGV